MKQADNQTELPILSRGLGDSLFVEATNDTAGVLCWSVNFISV